MNPVEKEPVMAKRTAGGTKGGTAGGELRAIRAQLADCLDWEEAHVGFDAAVRGVPTKLRGIAPQGFAHSIWQVVEHIRIAQADILDFCVNARSSNTMKWPDDYWPKSPAPRSAAAWNEALAKFRHDRLAMQRLAADPAVDLLAAIPHGSGQTCLREVLLVADHTAYHVAQIVDIRRALGNWVQK
jgi:hypothetical protein